MKFRVLNPRRRRRVKLHRRRRISRRSAKSRMAYVRSFIHKRKRKGSFMARRRRRSHRRKHNPILAIGNPRRRRARRSRRLRIRHALMLNPRRRRSHRRRRHSNPGARGGLISTNRVFNRSVLTQVLGVVAGYAGARVVKTTAAGFIPATWSPSMQGWASVGIKIVTASAGGYFLSGFNRQFGQSFVIGALFSAAWDVIALLTGNPVSLSEYVVPAANRSARLRSGNMALMRNAGAGMGSGGLAAYTSAFTKAF